MILKSASIRGAVGFYKGMNIDEVNLDFTQLQPGLVGLIGPNGVGKTTFMEMLQPFNTLVSRKGKIQDHFRLKNSYKILTAEHNGKLYESKLLIDGITGAAEAYIYENGVPLNDGKIKTFEEWTNKIFGSPDLFFNAIFSAQKATGIASLKFNERRALFYEILNLLKYETLYKNAGKRRAKEENKLATLEGELTALLAEANSITYTKPMIAEKIYGQQEKKKMLELAKVQLEALRADLEKITKSCIVLETRKNDMQSVKRDLDEVTSKINYYKLNIDESIASLKADREARVKEFETDNKYHDEIKRLESEKKVAQERYELEQKQINENIEAINKDILDCEALIEANRIKLDRVDRIQRNKKSIDDNLARKKEITEKLNQLVTNDATYTLQLAGTKELKNNRLKKVTELQSEVALKEKEITQLKSLNDKDEKRIDELKKEKLDKIAEVEKETAILKDVPCDEKLGKACPLISNTIDKKTKLDTTLSIYDADIESKLEETNKRLADIINLEKEVAESKGKIKTETESIEITFTPKVKEIEEQIEKIGKEVKELSKELTEINTVDWEKLQKEYSEAEQTKQLAEQSTANQKKLIEEKEKAKKTYEANLSTASTNFADKTASTDKQIEDKNKLFNAERETIIKSFDDKIKNLNENSTKDLEELKKKQTELNSKYDADIENTYKAEVEKQSKCQEDEKQALQAIEKIQQELADLEAEIKTMEDALARKKLNEDKIKEKEAGRALYNREIKEYTLIEKALDKTGIPVLKLENSGYEITSLANELLGIFDNKFRIVFETLQMKADKSGMKEVFNINVMDEEGICEIANKSGGQQVWLEIALQFAIGLMVRKQGKSIRTGFIDEKDGALDLENAYHFLDMVKKVHNLAGTHHSFLITHRTELQNLIPQQIHFVPDEGIRIVTEAI